MKLRKSKMTTEDLGVEHEHTPPLEVGVDERIPPFTAYVGDTVHMTHRINVPVEDFARLTREQVARKARDHVTKRVNELYDAIRIRP